MAVFATAPRLCSWAKISPRTVQSGRKTGKATTGKGNPYLKAALGQMAMGAAKTDTFLGARYRRLAKRMPKAKALAALERSILVVIFHLLADPTATFADLGTGLLRKAGRQTTPHRQPGPPARSPRPPRNPHHRGLTNHSPVPNPLRGLRPERGSAPHPAWRVRSSRLFHGCNFPVSPSLPWRAGRPRAKIVLACPPTPSFPWPLRPSCQPGAGAPPEGSRIVASSTPDRISVP
jgi:hypothetical protein